MSEEQQTAAQQSDAAPTPDTETMDTTVTVADEAPVQEAEAAEEPGEIRVFGMSRSRFHATVLGIAGGFFVSGFAGVLFHVDLNPTTCVVICALIGYTISFLIDRKREKNSTQNDR